MISKSNITKVIAKKELHNYEISFLNEFMLYI